MSGIRELSTEIRDARHPSAGVWRLLEWSLPIDVRWCQRGKTLIVKGAAAWPPACPDKALSTTVSVPEVSYFVMLPLLRTVYSRRNRLTKLLDDGTHFLRNGFQFPLLLDLAHMKSVTWRPHPTRTFVAGTDTPPPEAGSVPFRTADFDSDAHRRLILEPLRVTDSQGRVLPMWRAAKGASRRVDQDTTDIVAADSEVARQ